jgi:hypothetical protein
MSEPEPSFESDVALGASFVLALIGLVLVIRGLMEVFA